MLELSQPIVQLVKQACSQKTEYSLLQEKPLSAAPLNVYQTGIFVWRLGTLIPLTLLRTVTTETYLYLISVKNR